MNFKTMEEAKKWVKENQQRIEVDCPKYDMPAPTEVDLEECEQICANHWGCHTFRHLRGSRS